MNRELFGYEVETLNVNFNNIFILSDLHFGVRSNSIEWLDIQKEFFYDFYIPWLKENKKENDILFILGDWFDNRQLLDIFVMNISINIIEDLSSIIPVYFLTGNHDIYKKKDTDIHSLRVFKNINNVTIYEKPIRITNDKNSVLVMPWVGDMKEEELYAKANPSDYLFTHTDISGFLYDNGKEIIKGANLLSGTKFKKLLSGHIHKRQKQGNAYYIGSPYHMKRSDIGNTKGVHMLDTENDDLIFKENDFSAVFQKIRLEHLMEFTLKDAYNVLKNNFTDIIVPDKYIHLFSLPRFISLLNNCPYKRIEAAGEKIKLDEQDRIIQSEGSKDIKTLIEETIRTKGFSDEKTDDLIKLNDEYYKKVLNEEL